MQTPVNPGTARRVLVRSARVALGGVAVLVVAWLIGGAVLVPSLFARIGRTRLLMAAELVRFRPAIPPDSAGLMIRAAEDAGAAHPSAAAGDFVDQPFHRIQAGTEVRRCVDTGSADAVRSGDIVAGPFHRYRAIWRNGQAKLWWTPRFMTDSGPSELTIRAERIDRRADPVTFRLTQRAGNGVPPGVFFPSGVRLPSTGRWMIVVTAGPNWGCFLYKL